MTIVAPAAMTKDEIYVTNGCAVLALDDAQAGELVAVATNCIVSLDTEAGVPMSPGAAAYFDTTAQTVSTNFNHGEMIGMFVDRGSTQVSPGVFQKARVRLMTIVGNAV